MSGVDRWYPRRCVHFYEPQGIAGKATTHSSDQKQQTAANSQVPGTPDHNGMLNVCMYVRNPKML